MKSAVLLGALGGFVLAVATHEPARTPAKTRAAPSATPAPAPAAAPAPNASSNVSRDDAVLVPFFGNALCPVDGAPVDRAQRLALDGETVYACSASCVEAMRNEPARALERAYRCRKPLAPLMSVGCIVCARPRAAQGTELRFQGCTLELCGAGCERQLRLLPGIWLARATIPDLHDAGNVLCPVDDAAIDGVTVAVFRSTLVRLCSAGCQPAFEADPAAMLAKATGERAGG